MRMKKGDTDTVRVKSLKRKATSEAPHAPPTKQIRTTQAPSFFHSFNAQQPAPQPQPTLQRQSSVPSWGGVENSQIRLDKCADPFMHLLAQPPLLSFLLESRGSSQNIQNLILTAEQMGDLKKRNLRLLISCFIVKHSYDSRYPAHNWPAGFSLTVNNKWVAVVKREEQRKLIPLPADITEYLVVGANFIKCTSTSLIYAEPISVPKMVTKVRTLDFEEAKQKVLSSFVSHEDVVALSHKASLVDPLMRYRLKLPVRATTCSHIECFDLESYLEMNLHLQRWSCPICSKFALYEDLFIDSYFQQVLQEVLKEDSATEIIIYPDATWKLLIDSEKNPLVKQEPGDGGHIVEKKELEVLTLSVIDEDSEEDTELIAAYDRLIKATSEGLFVDEAGNDDDDYDDDDDDDDYDDDDDDEEDSSSSNPVEILSPIDLGIDLKDMRTMSSLLGIAIAAASHMIKNKIHIQSTKTTNNTTMNTRNTRTSTHTRPTTATTTTTTTSNTAERLPSWAISNTTPKISKQRPQHTTQRPASRLLTERSLPHTQQKHRGNTKETAICLSSSSED